MSLINILKKLRDADVDFSLVGGFAAVAHGSSMVTSDVDVACSMNPSNLEKVWLALRDTNPLHRMAKPMRPFRVEEARSGLFKNVYLSTDLGQVDLLGEVKGIGDYESVRSKSEMRDLSDFQLPIISLDALIEAKEAMGRPRDLENAKILRAIRERQSAS